MIKQTHLTSKNVARESEASEGCQINGRSAKRNSGPVLFDLGQGLVKRNRNFTQGFCLVVLDQSLGVLQLFQQLLVFSHIEDHGDLFALFVCQKARWFLHRFTLRRRWRLLLGRRGRLLAGYLPGLRASCAFCLLFVFRGVCVYGRCRRRSTWPERFCEWPRRFRGRLRGCQSRLEWAPRTFAAESIFAGE